MFTNSITTRKSEINSATSKGSAAVTVTFNSNAEMSARKTFERGPAIDTSTLPIRGLSKL
jgi:hypothetical protein